MAFAQLTDESGLGDLVLFPKVWNMYHHAVKEEELIFVEGNYDESNGRSQFIVRKITSVHSLTDKPKKRKTLYLRLQSDHHYSSVLEQVKNILLEEEGEIPVILYYEETKQMKHLSKEYNVVENNQLMQQLKNLLGDMNVVLKD
ncbi:DNA polymerase III alpha subunit [Halalkalibacter wakoensis JCM 9140]|uniref:DNA polymerase III alpha subunit n=1 Tax=Halalkalibacter wakoensis JCM 9140 TaxID=1236970 RepID=W4Q7Y6_9BACI|nr:hypothetical protein [Halalkalibacter wakoensis]GAE28107.1 DNA polymerase III alpha subunit [Halalkalibacter wakoensis JCM 9140]